VDRRLLEKHLRACGCIFHHHGGRHDIWINPRTLGQAPVPRHRHIEYDAGKWKEKAVTIKTKDETRGSLPESFEQLVRLMPPMAIRDDSQHANTVEVVDHLMRIDALSPGQSDYLETLVELIEVYEAKRHAIDISKVTGIQTVKYVLDQSGTSASELARLLNMHQTMGSKILNGDRKLTWEHAKVLGARFKVAPALFMD
jgi:antitoxin component HigA of HigAB toxin-antitoxin module